MAQPTTDPIPVEFAGLREETRAPAAERAGALELGTVLLKRWRLVVGLPLVAATLAAAVTLLLPPRFTATVTFVPEQRSPNRGGAGGGGGLVGIAGQLGIPLGMDPTQSPRFYAQVLKSRELLTRVLLTKFPDPRRPGAGDSLRLLTILKVRGKSNQVLADKTHLRGTVRHKILTALHPHRTLTALHPRNMVFHQTSRATMDTAMHPLSSLVR